MSKENTTAIEISAQVVAKCHKDLENSRRDSKMKKTIYQKAQDKENVALSRWNEAKEAHEEELRKLK